MKEAVRVALWLMLSYACWYGLEACYDSGRAEAEAAIIAKMEPCTTWGSWTLATAWAGEPLPLCSELTSWPWGVWCSQLATNNDVLVLAYFPSGVALTRQNECPP